MSVAKKPKIYPVSYTPPEEILSSKSCWIKIHDRKDSKVL